MNIKNADVVKRVMISIENIKLLVNYYYSKNYYNKIKNLHYKIMSLEETLNYMSTPGNSIVRFGDGEIRLINGIGLNNYQSNNKELSARLKEAALLNDNRMLVCFPDSLINLEDKMPRTKRYWICNFRENYNTYCALCRPEYVYGNAFVSRPYYNYLDKSKAEAHFKKFIDIFSNRDLLIIEGEYSRTGVGNNLLSNANSVRRIICPNTDAFDRYDDILKVTLKCSKELLVLIALGPTAKPLCFDLHKQGYWVLDVGHIDSEYEWYLKGTLGKDMISNKHTAEHVDREIANCEDSNYLESIIAKVL